MFIIHGSFDATAFFIWRGIVIIAHSIILVHWQLRHLTVLCGFLCLSARLRRAGIFLGRPMLMYGISNRSRLVRMDHVFLGNVGMFVSLLTGRNLCSKICSVRVIVWRL